MRYLILLFCRIRCILHCLKNFHTDVHYKIREKIIKIKCKECNKVFYENFKNHLDKQYFEDIIEKELDNKN